jgi:hypothetical protein
MGWDHSLSCADCKEELPNVGRNCKLYRGQDSLNQLEAFINKHADHHLIYAADDNWIRVRGAKQVRDIGE